MYYHFINNLTSVITYPALSLARTTSHLQSSQTFHLSFLASHNLSDPSTIAHNATQMAQSRLDDIAAIANLADMRVEEVPWLALRLEGLARRNADVDLYEGVLMPVMKVGGYLLMRALVPPSLASLVAMGGAVSIEKSGLEARHAEEEVELRRLVGARPEVIPWLTKEVVLVDPISRALMVKECQTVTTHGVLHKPLCLLAENVTEAGWVEFRVTWSAIVIGAYWLKVGGGGGGEMF